MKFILSIVTALILMSCGSPKPGDAPVQNEGITTFYFIRHAEKSNDSDDPVLSPKGEQRAKAWVNYFFLKPIDHILSTDYNRTRLTAAPLAKSKGMPIEIYDVKTATGSTLLEQYRGKTVVVFGHSNTVNKYTNDLQQDSTYAPLKENEYHNYFYVRVSKTGKSSGVKENMDFMTDL